MTKLSFLAGSVALFGRHQRREGNDANSLAKRYDDDMLKDIGPLRGEVEGLRRGR